MRDVLGMIIGGDFFGGSLALYTSVFTNTRSASWGGGTGGISCIFNVTWPTAALATAFFNTNGQIRLRLSHPAGATAQDSSWSSVLSRIGTVSFLRDITLRSGSLGTSTNVGFVDLTQTSQVIYDGTNIGGSAYGYAYANNDVTIKAVVLSNGVQFTVSLVDQHIAVGAGPDSVSAGTMLAVDVYRIPAAPPSFATITGFG